MKLDADTLLRYQVDVAANSAKPGNRSALIFPSTSSKGARANSSRTICKTDTFLFAITASLLGPCCCNRIGCNCNVALARTATLNTANQRDHSRAHFFLSKATGTTNATAPAIRRVGRSPEMCAHRAIAKPERNEKPAIRSRRIDSFTFGPKNLLERSRQTAPSAGPNATTMRKMTTSSGDNLAVEKTVPFLPYKSSNGCEIPTVERAK